MYGASAAFHNAIANDEPQMVLLIFDNAVFTNSDIDVSKGVVFHDYFNLEEDPAIGQALSNEISFTLFNDDGHLNNYEFGEFRALIGVRISSKKYKTQGNAMLVTKYATYVGSSSYPYIKRNGTAMAAQPSFAVVSLMSYGDKVYAYGESDRVAVYDDKTGANITASNNVADATRRRSHTWEGKGYYLNEKTLIMNVYGDNVQEKYEFVSLGKFSAVRPDSPDRIFIDFTCNDFMTKFDIDMPTAEETGMEYPMTIKKLLNNCCTLVGVENGEKSGNFINSDYKIEEEPEAFKHSKMRDVIAWIAEAAGANAHFDRDGKLKLVWLKSTGTSFDENNYSEFQPYWYKVPNVDRVVNRDTETAADDVEGAGKNGYLIQDNPFLRVEGTEPEGEQPWDKPANWPPLI